jgi:hypothetical protein
MQYWSQLLAKAAADEGQSETFFEDSRSTRWTNTSFRARYSEFSGAQAYLSARRGP